MENKTKIMLGVAAIGVATYLYYQGTNGQKTGFANANGKKGKSPMAKVAAKSASMARKKHFVQGNSFAQEGQFSNMSGGMHMMPDGSMMENSAMNLSGTVEAHQSTFNADGVFNATPSGSVFNNIVGDALVRRSTNWA